MINNIDAFNILSELAESGFMGTSTREALRFGIECILYVSKVKGAEEQLEKIWRGEE